MAYDASNRKDIRRAEKESALAETNRINYLVAAMSTMQGRVWFHDILTACHLFSDPFTGDALREAYSKGERNVGLRIFADIVAHCPDSYIQMMREANERNILNTSRTDGTGERSSRTESDGGDSEPDLFDADGASE